MAAAYSLDLRQRVVNDADAGLTSKELADRYHVSRAWVKKDRTRRYETVNGLARDLQRYLGGEPVEAAPASAA